MRALGIEAVRQGELQKFPCLRLPIVPDTDAGPIHFADIVPQVFGRSYKKTTILSIPLRFGANHLRRDLKVLKYDLY